VVTTEHSTLAPFQTGTQSHTYKITPTAFPAAPPFPKLTWLELNTKFPYTLTTTKRQLLLQPLAHSNFP
jgi:hypothetical protein